MKNLTFSPSGRQENTKIFDVIFKSNRVLLGKIYWYDSWNQYVFEANRNMTVIFGENDIMELHDFMKKLSSTKHQGVISIDPYNGKILGIKKKK